MGSSLEGRAAFVTGGGTGIGLACARAVVERGGRVTIAGRRAEVLEAAAAELGDAAAWVTCDITDAGSVAAAVGTAVERHGPLTLAVNSAYGAMLGSVRAMPPEMFTWTVENTLVGTFTALQAEARAMVEAGGGSIVNVSSVASVVSGAWEAPYAAAKAGVNALTRAAADELGRHGIRVNSVLPGLTTTDTASPLTGDAEVEAGFVRQTPLARLATPDDVAAAVAFLLSDDAAFVTGVALPVDGGLTLRGMPEPEHGRVLAGLLPDFFAEGEPG